MPNQRKCAPELEKKTASGHWTTNLRISLRGELNGQTIGKRLFHLRVIDEDGPPLRVEQARVRNLTRVFDALPFAYLVGGLSVLSSPLMQRFGDRVAGTLVVRQTPLATPAEEFWMRQKYNSFTDYPAIARGASIPKAKE